MRQKFSLVHSINAFLLKVLLLPSGVYERSGVNLRHLRSIVHAKLLVDERVPSSVFGTVANKRTGTLMVIFASLLVGAGMLIPFVFLDDLTRLTVFFGIYLIMLSMFLIVDFSHVLIDVRDNAVILPKPISAATFITARLVYIGIHFSKIVIPMILPAIVAMAVSRGLWAMFVFFLLVILCTFFAVLLVNLIYLIAIRFFSAERFKSLIATIQIVLSIVLFAGYQLVSRSAVEIAFAHVVISDSLWMWLNPPYWFAQAWMLGYTWDGGLAQLAGAALSVGMTVLGVYVVVKYFAPYFQHRLAAIGQGTASTRAVTLSKSSGRTSFAYIMAQIVTRKQATRAGFLFAWRMMSRSREFKMKFYPQVGYILVLVCVPFISYFRSFITGELDTARLVMPLIPLSI